MSKVDPRLLELLVCPLTKTRLTYDEKNQELISEVAGLAYPIRSGIPIMLIDEARPLDNEQDNQKDNKKKPDEKSQSFHE